MPGSSDADQKLGLFEGLRLRLFLTILAALVPILLALGYYILHQYQGLARASERDARSVVNIVSSYDHSLLDDTRETLVGLAQLPMLRDGRWRDCDRYFETLLGRLPRYTNLGVIDHAGRLVCSGTSETAAAAGLVADDRPYFQRAIESGFAMSGSLHGPLSDSPLLVLAVRINADDGSPLGVVYGALNVGFLRADGVLPKLFAGSRVQLADQSGHVLQQILATGEPQGDQPAGARTSLVPALEGAETFTGVDGEAWRRFTRIAGPTGDPRGLQVHYDVPVAALYAAADRALWVGSLVAFLLVCLAGLVAWVLIQRSMRRSERQAHQLMVKGLSEREALSHGLQARERLISHLLDVTVEAIYGVDEAGRCLFANQACAQLLGYERPEALVGREFHQLMHYQYEDGRPYPRAQCPIHWAMRDGRSLYLEEETLWRRDGTSFPAELWVYPLLRDGRLEFCLCTFLDVSERRAQSRVLAYQVTHDPLTDLLNRGEVLRRLKRRMQPGPAQAWSLVMANVDGFKEVNNALGHDVGDHLLCAVAACLRQRLGEGTLLARLGGDEFVFLLDTVDLDGSLVRVRQLLSAVREPFVLKDLQVRISCSFGIARFPHHSREPGDLLRCADAAMRRAKRDGLGIAVFNAHDRNRVHERAWLRGELRAALDQEQFVLHLQPKVRLDADCHTQCTPIGFEALARWQHPERGLIAPSQFIPMVEVSDLIHPFTHWVIRQAVLLCARLQAVRPGVRIAVNVSARNLLDDHFPLQVEEALRAQALPARLLELEVTESAIMEDPGRALATLNALHEAGVQLSIDDFGTGYSSFAYLSKLPVDVLKIDQSFVSRMVHDHSMRTIVRSIIGMSHTLQMSVIAEGIESVDALRLLRRMGCDSGQGYLMGRPAPYQAAAGWLEAARAGAPPADVRRHAGPPR